MLAIVALLAFSAYLAKAYPAGTKLIVTDVYATTLYNYAPNGEVLVTATNGVLYFNGIAKTSGSVALFGYPVHNGFGDNASISPDGNTVHIHQVEVIEPGGGGAGSGHLQLVPPEDDVYQSESDINMD